MQVNKDQTRGYCWIVLLSIVCCVVLFSNPVNAEEKKEAFTPQFKLDFSMDNNLILFRGKYVHVLLSSGQTLDGKVKDVKHGFLHLEKIAGRNYFDALIRVNDISAIEAQFRGL